MKGPSMFLTITGRRMMRLALFLLAVAGCYGANVGHAAAQAVCADDGTPFPKACTKEIRIYNNTAGPIWAVLQGSIQLTDALGCTVAGKGGGDVWLQAALGKSNDCFTVKNDYYAFINPTGGIPKGGFASIKLPWWSKRTATAPDRYIDWWRGGRVILFDDQKALNEIYNKLKGNPQVAFAAGSPKPLCNKAKTDSACSKLQVFQVAPGTAIDPHLPFQLNEFTFADVAKVTDNGTKGGNFIDFNQGYNVSNVDQVYLPLAIEPVRAPADVGYMGTTMAVSLFRKQLTGFTKANLRPTNPDWPIYNNPTVNGSKLYPKAGIRVPSAQSVFAFYMNPFPFPDGKTPAIIPQDPPKLVQNMMNQWNNCTAASPKNCPQSAYYKAVNSVFLDNYKSYADTCNKIPDFLKPVNNNPQTPKETAFLTFIYGWVPFNVACPNKELPVVDDPPPPSRSVIDYFQMQYNYQDLSLNALKWFNPYTQLIHDDVAAGGLSASAYAYSIDDQASFLSNSGGSLPGGLIFAVGGPTGLRNGKPHAPPVPAHYKWFDFSVGLGAPAAGAPYWKKYGICSNTADILFPQESKVGWVFGVDPALTRIDDQNPCPITLLDSANRKYQFVILRAKAPGITLPQTAIWPAFEPKAGKNFDPTVVACPAKNGFVPPEKWCNLANEKSQPELSPGFYTIGAPPPLP